MISFRLQAIGHCGCPSLPHTAICNQPSFHLIFVAIEQHEGAHELDWRLDVSVRHLLRRLFIYAGDICETQVLQHGSLKVQHLWC